MKGKKENDSIEIEIEREAIKEKMSVKQTMKDRYREQLHKW